MAKKQPGTDIISADELERQMKDYMKESAKALANAEPIYGNMNIVRTKNKVFSLGDQKLPAPLKIVVIAQAAVQLYYETEYDADEKSSPVCYALAGDDPFRPDSVAAEQRLVPDSKAPKVQTEGPCALCPQNKPGTGKKGGWTRACQARRRLAFLFADDNSKDPQVGSIEISASGLRHWTAYIKSLAGVNGMPFYMVVTELNFVDTKDDTWYVGASYAGPLTRHRPEWVTPPKGVKIGSDGWLEQTFIGQKVRALIESKTLIAPPAMMADKPKGKGKPVTGASRVSVAEAKAQRAAKKKGR